MEQNIFNHLEIDILQETLNIAFGSASAELAEVIDIFISLDTPNVKVININQIEDYISIQTGIQQKYNIVEQHFSGEVKGVTLLIFPDGSGHELLSYFDKDGSDYPLSLSLEGLDREALMEIGNILIGACMSKLFDLLHLYINFFPPRIIEVTREFRQFFDEESFNANSNIITLKTTFKFEDKNITGHLFIITNNDSSSVS